MSQNGHPALARWLLLLACVVSTTVMLTAAEAAQTLWRPPALGRVSASVATVLTELISGLRIGGVPVVLAQTPLEGVRARLGGTIGRAGDAGDFLSWLCVAGTDQHGRWGLWLESAEIDEGLVGGFQLRRIAGDVRLDRRCTTMRGNPTGIELPRDLSLGMPRSNVLETLGQPTRETRNALIYRHQHEEAKMGDPAGPQPYPVINDLILLLQGGRVYTIGVTKYTLW